MTTAEMALLAHPLIRDWELVKKMLPELIQANLQWLPKFNRA